MGISNDWQNIDELAYKNVPEKDGYSYVLCYTLNQTSSQKLASAIGWEVCSFDESCEYITVGSCHYLASAFYPIRPIAGSDEPEYNVGFMLGIWSSGGHGAMYGLGLFNLTTGNRITSFYAGRPASIQLLRPTAQGAFCLKIGDRKKVFDKFLSPKIQKVKWGVTEKDSSNFADFYTGNNFSPIDVSESSQHRVIGGSFGGYLALKKFTAIAGEGVYNAISLYMSFIDYSSGEKTIVLDGATYVGITDSSSYAPFYIRLAD